MTDKYVTTQGKKNFAYVIFKNIILLIYFLYFWLRWVSVALWAFL